MATPIDARAAAGGDRTLDGLVEECVLAFHSTGPDGVERVLAEHPASADELRERLRRLERLGVLGRTPREAELPERIGPYRVLAEIGRGGMGAVYRAEQTGPVTRTVAVKVIKLGLDTRETLARFDLERRTLAVMDHPNIARVFDAGSTDDGRPYFVMELVDGVPVTDYCDAQRLNVQERIQLFVKVCEAVQHAHQKGVIHRDLKPSNVLVGVVDGALEEARAEPKVIDFGIAKAMDHHADGLTQGTMRTMPGQLVGTPEYMSPEQATFGGASVDTRSDVYSLGVMLYELLTGALPFEPDHLWRTDLAGMQRILAAEPPARASARVSTLADGGAVAELRRASPAELRRQLRGDLDWVLQKALAKEPERRYPSPLQLANDVRRHLAHEPVSAGPPSSLYRFRKLVQRNRGRFAAGVALALTILIGFVTSTVLYFDKRAAHRREAAARTTAEDRAAEAEEVAQFLEDLFRFASPTHPDRGATPVREVFAQGVARVRQEFPDRPLVRARLEARIGRVYYWLGADARALELVDEAIALREPFVDADDAELLGWRLERAMALQSAGRAAEAGAIYATSLQRSPRSAGERLEYGRTMSLLGSAFRDQGRVDEAGERLRAAVDFLREVDTANEGYLAAALNHLANFLHDTGRAGEALPLFEESLRLKRALYPKGHPVIPEIELNLVRCLMTLGRFVDAEAALRRVLSSAERILGVKHPTYARILVTQAKLLGRLGRTGEVEARLRRALAIREEVLAPNHPDRAWSLNDLACRLIDGERYAEAARLLRRAVLAYRSVHPGDHLHTAIALSNLAVSLANSGDLPAADRAVNESIEMHSRLASSDPASRASSWNALAVVRRQQGRMVEAKTALWKALELWGQAPNAVWDAGWGHVRLAFLHNLSRESAAAERAAREGLRLLRSASSIDHAYIANALFQTAWALQDQGRGAAARPFYRESIEMYDRVVPEGNVVVSYVLERAAALSRKTALDEAVDMLVRCYELRRRFLGVKSRLTRAAGEGAVRFARELLARDRARHGSASVAVGRATSQLGHLLGSVAAGTAADAEAAAEAETLLRRADAIFAAGEGGDAQRYARTNLEWLAEFYKERDRAEDARSIRARLRAMPAGSDEKGRNGR